MRRVEQLKLAGLTPTELSPALAERLRRLYGPDLAMRSVWRMSNGDGEIFVLDLWRAGHLSVPGLVAVVSPKLALPALHLEPRRWHDRLLGRGSPGIAFPDDPQLARAWRVRSDDEDRARTLLGGSRGLWLAQLPPVPWDGEGQLLCVRTTGWREVPVSQALENAGALYSVLTR